MRAIHGLCVILLAGCAASPLPDLMPQTAAVELSPEPLTYATAPKLGTMSITSGNEVISRSLVDFSVGAVDPSAWFEVVAGVPTLYLKGFDTADTVLRGDKSILISAAFPTVGPGVSTTASLQAIGNGGVDVRGVARDDFQVFVTSVTPTDNPDFSRLTGTFAGTICRIVKEPVDDCAPLTGDFDTAAAVQN